MMVKMLVKVAVYLLLFAAAAQAETGRVVSVTDGDTIKVMLHGVQTDIRLYGVDSPEKKQAFGQAARDFTASQVAGKEVEIEQVSTSFGRTVALVKYDLGSLQEQLVVSGHAWVYNDYCKKPVCNNWRLLEHVAQTNQEGLWVDPRPVPPWTWRKER